MKMRDHIGRAIRALKCSDIKNLSLITVVKSESLGGGGRKEEKIDKNVHYLNSILHFDLIIN